jgi:hypothetical protein
VHGAAAASRKEHGLRALSSLRARFTQVAYFPNLKGRLGVDRFGFQDSREGFDVPPPERTDIQKELGFPLLRIGGPEREIDHAARRAWEICDIPLRPMALAARIRSLIAERVQRHRIACV